MVKFGFDLDGVLYPWHELVWENYRERLGVPNISFFDFWKVPGGFVSSHEGELSIVNMVHDPTMYDKAVVRPEYLAAVKRIAAAVGEVWYITNRFLGAKPETERWLRRSRFPQCEHFVFNSNGESKSEAVDRLGIHIYIEDRPKHIEELLGSSLKYLIIRDRPWNRFEWFTNRMSIVRVSSICDVPELLEEGFIDVS